MEAAPLSLVADVGRVSVRFALSGGGHGKAPRDIRNYHTADHSSFTSALVCYLREMGLEDTVLPSALAIAGATRSDLISLTGGHWYISLSGVESVLRARPRALNECSATALALTTLPDDAFTTLPGVGRRRAVEVGGNYLVVSLGTGLGVAGLVSDGDRLTPVQSEAAHMSFAATTRAEAEVVEAIGRGGAVTNEAILSARGLVAIHNALAGPHGGKLERPEDVTRNAARDPAAAAAVNLFTEALGAVAGDLVLAFGAWDGLYLTGAMARALQRPLSQPGFRARLTAKGAFRRQLQDLPVAIVNRTGLELVGAAVALDR